MNIYKNKNVKISKNDYQLENQKNVKNIPLIGPFKKGPFKGAFHMDFLLSLCWLCCVVLLPSAMARGLPPIVSPSLAGFQAKL